MMSEEKKISAQEDAELNLDQLEEVAGGQHLQREDSRAILAEGAAADKLADLIDAEFEKIMSNN